MVEACRIDEAILEEMTTKQLVYAVLDYPLLSDILLYSSFEEGVEALHNKSDALNYLLK